MDPMESSLDLWIRQFTSCSGNHIICRFPPEGDGRSRRGGSPQTVGDQPDSQQALAMAVAGRESPTAALERIGGAAVTFPGWSQYWIVFKASGVPVEAILFCINYCLLENKVSSDSSYIPGSPLLLLHHTPPFLPLLRLLLPPLFHLLHLNNQTGNPGKRKVT